MEVIFDHDAEGKTDIEAYNYVPEGMDVIGNLIAAEIAMKRYNSYIHFKGEEYKQWPLFLIAYHADLNERGINLP